MFSAISRAVIALIFVLISLGRFVSANPVEIVPVALSSGGYEESQNIEKSIYTRDQFSPQVSKSTHSGNAKWFYYFDDSSTLMLFKESEVEISFDDGGSWLTIPAFKNYRIISIKMDPFNRKRAFAFSLKTTHFYTEDCGKSWKHYEIVPSTNLNQWSNVHLDFNSRDPSQMIITFRICEGIVFMEKCTNSVYYTANGFKSDPSILLEDATSCVFGASSPDFSKELNPNTIFCAKSSRNSFGHTVKSSLLRSTNYFKSFDIIQNPTFDSGEIIDVRVDSAFLVSVVQKDKFNLKSQVSLVVSRNGLDFDVLDLDFEMSYGAIIFLESSPLSIFLSVVKPVRGANFEEATVYSSDSTGLKYKPLLDHVSVPSLTKAQYVDGVWFANVIDETPELSTGTLLFTSKVSVDDGKSWDLLQILDDDLCKISDGCALQYFSLSDVIDDERFVTGPTANILLAVGAKGRNSAGTNDAHTYISRDGGITWKLALDEPCVYVFGDQGNIIVAVPISFSTEGKLVDKFFFSIDQGLSWQMQSIETPIYPQQMSTALDGSSSKIVLFGVSQKSEEILYSLDFAKAFGGKSCSPNDFETVFARLPPGFTSPTCVRGHKESFSRRKQDAKCLVNAPFQDVKETDEPCECTVEDFECSVFFKFSEKGECVPDYGRIFKFCVEQKKEKVTIKHKQLIQGDLCKFEKKKESDFVAETEFDCSKLGGNNGGDYESPVSDILISSQSLINGVLTQYSYVSPGDGIPDNILVATNENQVYASNDGGVSFVKVNTDEKVMFFIAGPVAGTVVLASLKFLYYSTDGANTFEKLQSPGVPSHYVAPFSFHPTDKLKFLYFSGDGCGTANGGDCQSYFTENGGESFSPLLKDAVMCQYVNDAFNMESELIFCTVQEGTRKKLVSSANHFKDSTTLLENIVAFAVRTHFVLVAVLTEDMKQLKAKVTVDGATFADVDFPSDFVLEAQTAYTVLDSEADSIFMHVTTVRTPGNEQGAILKSNSNGTFYVLSIDNVNRNLRGYVDYDRMDAMEGFLIVNTVLGEASLEGGKKLKSQISFNDGSEWLYIQPPVLDSEGVPYACGTSLEKCSLNLQGFTERPDFKDRFSSSSAIGYLIGVGTVGEYLDSNSPLATFMSSDGGLTWKEIKKGAYMWEYGDRGTILMLVDAVNPTNEIIYSTDDGTTWNSYLFSDTPNRIWDSATVPSDNSRKFILFGGDSADSDHSTIVYSIDFTHFFARQCQLDLDNPLNDDFEYWSPRRFGSNDNCFLGRETNFLRRAKGHSDCFIGSAPLGDGVKVSRNCSCTRSDYECDYNYFRDTDGTCKLVKGLTPKSRKQAMCNKENTFQYFEPTGYRKIPSSSCSGGQTFDAWDARACPGHQKEFDEFYGRNMTATKVVMLFLIPGAVFVTAVWFVYERGIKRNGGFQRLGQIRLEDDDDFNPIEENAVDVVVNRIVRGGIIVVAGAIAVFKTARRLDGALFDAIAGRIFGRRAGHRSYVRVPDEEDELFGNFADDFEPEIGDSTDFEVGEADDFEDFTTHQPEDGASLFGIDEDEGQ